MKKFMRERRAAERAAVKAVNDGLKMMVVTQLVAFAKSGLCKTNPGACSAMCESNEAACKSRRRKDRSNCRRVKSWMREQRRQSDKALKVLAAANKAALEAVRKSGACDQYPALCKSLEAANAEIRIDGKDGDISYKKIGGPRLPSSPIQPSPIRRRRRWERR